MAKHPARLTCCWLEYSPPGRHTPPILIGMYAGQPMSFLLGLVPRAGLYSTSLAVLHPQRTAARQLDLWCGQVDDVSAIFTVRVKSDRRGVFGCQLPLHGSPWSVPRRRTVLPAAPLPALQRFCQLGCAADMHSRAAGRTDSDNALLCHAW